MKNVTTDRMREVMLASFVSSRRVFGTRPENAERRRAALVRMMAKYGYTPTTLAQAIGQKGPNSIYNLLNGHADSLSQEMIERILSVLNGVSFEELVGWSLHDNTPQVSAPAPGASRPGLPVGNGSEPA